MVRTRVETQGWAEMGMLVARYREQCARLPGRPGSTEAIASRRPWWQSLVTSWTPDRHRAARPRRNASQPRAALGGGHVQAEDLPVAAGVDAGGDQGVRVHRPAAL